MRSPAFVPSVEVEAAARLHLGFVDLHGGLGRRFGSLGVAIDGLATRVRVERAAVTEASGPGAARALAVAESVRALGGMESGVRIEIHSAIPEHEGLGSGTQLTLAVATAVATLFGMPADAAALACAAGRGARSGVGIGVFREGGFVVDGGRGPRTGVPPVVARLAFPEDWRLLLVSDAARTGVSGSAELDAFGRLAPMAEAVAGELARRVLVQLLPALVESDFDAASEAIGAIQARVGDHFAASQGGRYTSRDVADVLDWLQCEGIGGIGQSSWGPTGFALVPDARAAEVLLARARARWADRPAVHFAVHAGRNRGAQIAIGGQPQRSVPALQA